MIESLLGFVFKLVLGVFMLPIFLITVVGLLISGLFSRVKKGVKRLFTPPKNQASYRQNYYR